MDITEEQARQVIEDDKRIDNNEKLFELTEEQKANSKKARAVGSRKVTATNSKRTHKEDADKQELIAVLGTALKECDTNLNITNPERQIDFQYNGRKFRVVLSAPRT